MLNSKNEMIRRVNDFLAEYETGTADMRPLESLAEALIMSAKLAGYDIKKANDYVNAYCESFDPQDLAAAIEAVKEEVEAA